jgi:hypothetical protein
MTILNWHVSDIDATLIRKIADRAWTEILALRAGGYTRLDVTMDFQATHANGNPLDLARLLEFPPFDFAHDVIGIVNHLNRETGKLERCFSPRCTARQVPA